ncbi:MAG: aspartyl protease family protein [bacterium]
MGTFNVIVALPKRQKIGTLVDTGATFSKFSQELLHKLSVKTSFKTNVELGDGRRVERKVGYVQVSIAGRSAPVPVVFGRKRERAVIGATTLEILDLIPDPRKKILIESIHLEI